MADNPVATIELENGGTVTAKLFPDIAPNTVNNFISLVNQGFYNGLMFHRVIPGFMVQGGCPKGTGTGGPGYSIPGEFGSNGVANPLKHDRGVLSMARSQSPDSAGSQFFVMVATSPHLDGEYAGFGKVTAGMDVIDKVVGANRNSQDRPLKDQRIKSVSVDTFGVDYPEPVTV